VIDHDQSFGQQRQYLKLPLVLFLATRRHVTSFRPCPGFSMLISKMHSVAANGLATSVKAMLDAITVILVMRAAAARSPEFG